MSNGEIIKECSCGQKYTAELWQALGSRKIWVLPWGEVQELRNCICGSTIVVILHSGTPEERPSLGDLINQRARKGARCCTLREQLSRTPKGEGGEQIRALLQKQLNAAETEYKRLVEEEERERERSS